MRRRFWHLPRGPDGRNASDPAARLEAKLIYHAAIRAGDVDGRDSAQTGSQSFALAFEGNADRMTAAAALEIKAHI